VALSVSDNLHYRTLGVTQPPARWSSDFPPPNIIGGRSPGSPGPLRFYYIGHNESKMWASLLPLRIKVSDGAASIYEFPILPEVTVFPEMSVADLDIL